MNFEVKSVSSSLVLFSILLLSACSEQAPDAPKPNAEPVVIAKTVAPKPTPVISAEAQKYEGKIVRQPPANRGKDDGWYLVKNGQRKWIIDGTWLEKNGYQSSAVIEVSSKEFNDIPEDPTPIK